LVAHLLWEQRVAGSNPVTPTISGSTVAQNVSRGEAMPSYRSILTVTTLAPGCRPEEVEQAARAVTLLESWDIAITAGQPRVTARFTAVDDSEARATHAAIVGGVRQVADVPRARLAAVVRGRSHYLTT
jgi:hypothetical protein